MSGVKNVSIFILTLHKRQTNCIHFTLHLYEKVSVVDYEDENMKIREQTIQYVIMMTVKKMRANVSVMNELVFMCFYIYLKRLGLIQRSESVTKENK